MFVTAFYLLCYVFSYIFSIVIYIIYHNYTFIEMYFLSLFFVEPHILTTKYSLLLSPYPELFSINLIKGHLVKFIWELPAADQGLRQRPLVLFMVLRAGS